MKIGIIGLGFVGLSFASVLASKGHSVIGVDSDERKVSSINGGVTLFYEPRLDIVLEKALKKDLTITTDLSLAVHTCNFIFVTVGTPQRNGGLIDLSMVKSAIIKIGKLLTKTKNEPIIIIKSTVIPGTTGNVILPLLEKKSGKKAGKHFGLITNPEFLREGKAIEDTLKPHVVVLGGNNDKFMNRFEKFYTNFHPNVPIIKTNFQTAEMIKYANNSFLATKISFINQIATICESIPGANVEDVAKTIGLDPRIGNLFLNAGPGYGGSCLPKDIKAIINFSSKQGIKPILFDAVEQINRNQVKNIILTIKKLLGKINDKTITILGLAFKPDTDDIRDSVSIKLIEELQKKGVKIKVQDPKAIDNTKSIFGDKIQYEYSIKNALKDSYCGVIMTPWEQYSRITKNDIKSMKTKVIIDTRRMLNYQKLGIDYYAIGIGR